MIKNTYLSESTCTTASAGASVPKNDYVAFKELIIAQEEIKEVSIKE